MESFGAKITAAESARLVLIPKSWEGQRVCFYQHRNTVNAKDNIEF